MSYHHFFVHEFSSVVDIVSLFRPEARKSSSHFGALDRESARSCSSFPLTHFLFRMALCPTIQVSIRHSLCMKVWKHAPADRVHVTEVYWTISHTHFFICTAPAVVSTNRFESARSFSSVRPPMCREGGSRLRAHSSAP